jgi:signal transduction histidine kinase
VRKAEFPYLADWLAISLRWFSLLGITIALTSIERFQWPVTAFLIFSAIWNIFMAMLAMLNHRLPGHRFVNTIVDLITTLGLFVLGGGITGMLTWAGILNLLSAAVYFEWRGSISIAILLSLFQVIYTIVLYPDFQAYTIPLGLLSAFNLTLGTLLGLGSKQLMTRLRRTYNAQLNRRREMEKNAQKQERLRMQTFYKLMETLGSTLNYRVVLDSVLDLSQVAMAGTKEADRITSAMLLFADHDLTVANARRFTPSDMKRTFPAEKGILRDTLNAGQAQITTQPTLDPELSKILGLQSCKSAVTVPLARGLDTYGVILFGHPEETFFNPERVEMLEMISQQAVISIQNARLYQQLEQEKEVILETQEEARKKLARDLHDGPTQSVAAIAMRINIARKMLELTPQDVEPELQRIEDLARRTTGEIRHMLFTLRPLALESEGLVVALNTIAEKTQTTYDQKVRMEIDETIIERLDMNKQTVIFYLVEEAVNNARKHAQADLIWVRLRSAGNDTEIAHLEIMDNGVGFDLESVSGNYYQRGSLGMVNLRERTQLINGLLNINSVPGRGTRVQIYIPLTSTAEERIQQGKFELQQT